MKGNNENDNNSLVNKGSLFARLRNFINKPLVNKNNLFDNLPKETKIEIFKNLEEKDMRNAAQVSKSWRSLIKEEKSLIYTLTIKGFSELGRLIEALGNKPLHYIKLDLGL